MRLKPVYGLCDRCSLRWPLSELKWEFVLGKKTGYRTCPDCFDESHPQLDTRGVKTNDKQSVKNSRSDSIEWDASRRLYGWQPVGNEATGVVDVKLGNVTVVIT